MATIEIDGKTIETSSDKMIIEVADEAGIYIPRFCYHKKLSIAANCRMCLVEVEKSRKPLPACATPITDGMRVFTKSEEALRSQRAVMEFLLINHPLDCPICDQGGECELQDLSMGFGADASHYEETKRSVVDDNLGPLIATEMTRCIQCTRCVRFGDEIAGLNELGATSRGENMQIGTYVEHSMRSEVSGNIIDLCPVGALTAKPSRYAARPWELTQKDGITAHDCLGSNIHLHTRRNELIRVVPRENEMINETWITDRDRFGYAGINSDARLLRPAIKRDGQWEEVEWQEALEFAAHGIARVIKEHGADKFAAMAAPSSTTEECYLLQKLMRELGVQNLDHRLQQTDFRDGTFVARNTATIGEVENKANILVLGCNLLREVPLLGLRVRKAAGNGAAVYAMNYADFAINFTLTDSIIIAPHQLPGLLAGLVKFLAMDLAVELPEKLAELLEEITVDERLLALKEALCRPDSLIITGALFANHPDAALLRTLLYYIEQLSGAALLAVTAGANSNGALLAGMVPEHSLSHEAATGRDVESCFKDAMRGYMLLGIEPEFDCANPNRARHALLGADFVVYAGSFVSDTLGEYADVMLPAAVFAETSGTFVNLDGTWQSFAGAVAPQGEARPAWKILRVLGNLLHCDGFDYTSSTEILADIRRALDMKTLPQYEPFYPKAMPKRMRGLQRIGEWPLYRVDALVRHAEVLQLCASADTACIKIHPDTAKRLKLSHSATIAQGDIEITLPLEYDERIARDAVWVPNAMPETIDLGYSFAPITVRA